MGARAQGAQMLPQFRPEGRGKAGVSLPLAWAPACPRALSRLCRPVPGGAASCSPSWAQREPRLAPGTRAPPPCPVPATHTHGTRYEGRRRSGAATQPGGYVDSRASTAGTACSRRPRAPPPGRGGRDHGCRRSRRRAAPWGSEDGATAHRARPHCGRRDARRRRGADPGSACCPLTSPSPRPRRLDSTRTSRPQWL